MWLAFKLRVTSSVVKQGRDKGWRRVGQREAGGGRQWRDDSFFCNVRWGHGCWQSKLHGRENSCFPHVQTSVWWGKETRSILPSITQRGLGFFFPSSRLALAFYAIHWDLFSLYINYTPLNYTPESAQLHRHPQKGPCPLQSAYYICIFNLKEK